MERYPHEHMQQPLWVTRNWLAKNTPVFRESVRRAKACATKGMWSIRSYFAAVRRSLFGVFGIVHRIELDAVRLCYIGNFSLFREFVHD